MKFQQPISLSEVIKCIGGIISGEENNLVTGANEIHKVKEGDITFVDHPKFYKIAVNSDATYIIIDREIDANGKTLIIHEDPFSAFNILTQQFYPHKEKGTFTFRDGYHISSLAQVGKNTQIMPGCVIGDHVEIGDHCFINPNVSIINATKIGDHVKIGSGTAIGGDAFYYKSRSGSTNRHDPFVSVGKVVIEDDVEIGSGCTIDRGVTSETIIGQGTKIDNLVMIGHGVEIGKNCLIAAQVGIAGKTILEDEVILWGQVGVSKNLRLGKGSVVLAQSGVGKDLEPGKTYFGSPCEEARGKWKEMAILKQIAKNTK